MRNAGTAPLAAPTPAEASVWPSRPAARKAKCIISRSISRLGIKGSSGKNFLANATHGVPSPLRNGNGWFSLRRVPLTHSRRDTIKLGLFGSICAGIGEFPANAFPQAAVESTQIVAQPPQWAKGLEGQRKADLGNGYYLNPIIPGNASDPDVLKDGNDYYMTFSTFEEYPGLPVYHSRDLVNWVRIGSA